MTKKHFKFLFLCLFLIFAINPVASAESALEITIEGTSPEGYQVNMVIPYKTDMNNDFSNIRFFAHNTQFNGGTSIPYWVESYTAGTTANVWVSLPSGTTKIYCEWGIAGETTSESNIKAVMVYGDDFSENSLNTTLWTSVVLGGTRTFSNGVMIDSITSATPARNVITANTDRNTAEVISVVKTRTTTSTGTDCSARFGIKSNSTAGAKLALRTAAGIRHISPLDENIAWGTDLQTYQNNVWYILEIRHDYLSTFYYRVGQTGEWSSWAINPTATHLTLHTDTTTNTVVAEYDYAYQRLYDPTPATATVGTTVITAPVASFSGSPTSGMYPLSVIFTDSSTNSPTSWEWNFGDGYTATTQNPTHTYETAGNYTVTLAVTNSVNTNTTIKANYITITSPATAPVANFSADKVSGNFPLTVQFTDSSTQSPTSWAWNFGDGATSTLQNPTHTYTTYGNFTVSLISTNAKGSDTETKTTYIRTTYVPPAASFTCVKTGFYEWTCTSTTTGYVTMYYWEFGDGDVSFDRSTVIHDYGKNGTYTIELVAFNPSGYTSASHTVQMFGQEGDAEINTSEERVLILNENTSYTFNITSNITLDHTEFWVNGNLFQVEGNELTYNFTEGGVYYNVTAYGVSSSGNYSAPVTWRVTVHRGLATTHMEKFDETNYNYLMTNITHFNATSIAEISTLPFTNLMGRAFYLILFVMPFALLWMKQRMLTIPVVMALITGCLFIGLIPAQYLGFLTYAVILSFAVALYLLGRERF